MLKSALFASAMIVAGPAFAQESQTPAPTAPTAAPGDASVPATPAESTQTATAGGQDMAGQAPADQSASTAGQPAGGDQVTTIINAEFATYDKDANGTLEKAEFAAWMDALKAKAPDGAGKPSDTKWNEAAFAQADKDKSTSVTKDELTGFLRG